MFFEEVWRVKSLDPVKSRLLPSREGMEFGEFSPGEILIAAERRGMVHNSPIEGSRNKQCKEDLKKKQQTHLWPDRNGDWIRVAGTCDLWGVEYSPEAKISVAAVPHANPALQSQPTDDSSVWVPIATQHAIIACNKDMRRIRHMCFEFLPVSFFVASIHPC